MSNPVNTVAITTIKAKSQKKNCCCNCCYCCDCCECCHCGQCIDCDDCCGCKCFCCIFTKILLSLILFFFDLFTLFFRIILGFCIGCELFPFSRLLLNSDWIGLGFKIPMFGCYCCLLYEICCNDYGRSGTSSGYSHSGGGGGNSNRGGGNSYGGGENSYGGGANKDSNSGGDGKKDWDHEPNYAYQNPSGRDDYGNPTYTRYNENYAYENPTGRDSYGNPTYG